MEVSPGYPHPVLGATIARQGCKKGMRVTGGMKSELRRYGYHDKPVLV